MDWEARNLRHGTPTIGRVPTATALGETAVSATRGIGGDRDGQIDSRHADQTSAQSPRVASRRSLRPSMPLYDGGEQDARKGNAAVRVDEVAIERPVDCADFVANVHLVVWHWYATRSPHELVQKWHPAYQTWGKEAHELFIERLITSETLLQPVPIDARFREDAAVFESDRMSTLARWQKLTSEAKLRTLRVANSAGALPGWQAGYCS